MSQVVAPRWLTNTWRARFFYNSCRTWFIKIIEGEWKRKPSGIYWQLFLLVEMSIWTPSLIWSETRRDFLARLFAPKSLAKSFPESLGSDHMHDSRRDSPRLVFFYAGSHSFTLLLVCYCDIDNNAESWHKNQRAEFRNLSWGIYSETLTAI